MSLKSSLLHTYTLYRNEPVPVKLLGAPLAFWLGLFPAGVIVGLLIGWLW